MGEEFAKDTLSLMSWNVRNYNLTNRYIYGSYHYDYPKPEEEKTALREVISKVSPDVLLVQEVGGDEFLRELVTDLNVNEGVDYPYYATVSAEDKVRKVGLISKIPFEWQDNDLSGKKAISYLGENVMVKRGLLEVRLNLGGREVTIMAIHLKSRFTSDKRDPESEIRREKEARTIRNYIRGILKTEPNKAIILMGDLNDHSGSKAYRRFIEVSGDTLLTDFQINDGRNEVWTYFHKAQRRYEQIDYVFLSPVLTAGDDWQVQGEIIDGDRVLLASDHRPIIIKLKAVR